MQTSYNTTMPIARAGLMADLNPSTMVTLNNTSKMLVSFAITAANTTVYTVVINGVTATYTSSGSATTAEISAGLVAAINGASGIGVTATDLTGSFTVTGSNYGTPFTYASTGAGVLTATSQVGGNLSIPFGALVVNGDTDGKGRLPYQATDITTVSNPAGVAVQDGAIPQSSVTTVAAYDQGRTMNICRRGRVYVQVENAVVKGGAVYVRFAPGAGGTQVGSFRADADSGTAALLANAQYATSAAASGFSILGLNLI